MNWNKYPQTPPPPKRKKYLVFRAGKCHFAKWNGTNWTYDDNVITHWREVTPPDGCSFEVGSEF